MDPISAILAGGLNSRLDSLDLLANNLSNASAEGYKADRERFAAYLGADAAEALRAGDSARESQMPVVEDRYTDYRQGGFVATGIPTDAAIDGEGFFAIETTRGTRYTRAGRFRLSPDGDLQTGDGFRVRVTTTTGDRRLNADPRRPVRIESNGDVVQDGRILGNIDRVRFNKPELLRKEEGVYFRALTGQTEQPAATGLRSESLEASNVDPAAASFRLIETTRQFGLLQRAFGLQDGLQRGLIERVARW